MAAVLVIDDDIGTLTTYRQVLQLEGFEVCTADTGRAGMQLLEQRPFDLVLVDFRLPDLDGVTLLRTVRAAHISVPFVVVTGFGTVASAVEAMQLGARDYVEKPIFTDELVRVVKSSMLGPTNRWTADTSRSVEEVAESYVPRAIAFIKQRYWDPALTSRVLAAELNICTAHLCRLIKQSTMQNVGSHISATRIRETQRLLRETTLTTKEIATRVGYQRVSQLDRYFRRYSGLTPTEYRRMARQEPTS